MSSDGSTHDGIRASLQLAHGNGVVRIEAELDSDVENVWSALTQKHRLGDWYGEIEGELHAGGTFRARLFASGWEGTGRVEACEAPRRLMTVSRDPDVPFEDSTEVTLRTDGHRTILVIEQTGIPLDMLWAYGAGLQIHVEDLVGHIAGHERADSEPRFEALTPRYQALAADLS